MKKKQIFITNYRQAWIEFRRSKEYLSCYESMKLNGIKQRYANNILQSAFAAGWGNKEIVQVNTAKQI